MQKRFLILAILTSLSGWSYAEDGAVEPPLMLNEARETQITDLSVHQLKRRFFPFNERQVKELKIKEEEQSRYVNESVRDPDIQQRTIGVKLAVNNEGLDLYSSVNFQTNLIFIDKQGEPWPIEKYGVGATDFFTAEQYLPHALQISPLKKYSKTNLTVLLKGEVIPLVFTINEDKDVVDYLTQIKVAGIRPDAQDGSYTRERQTRGVSSVASYSSGEEMDMRDGITPEHATALSVIKDGRPMVDTLSWSYGGSHYIRIKGEMIVPSGTLLATGIDRYKLFKIPPVQTIMIERDGMVITDVQLIKN